MMIEKLISFASTDVVSKGDPYSDDYNLNTTSDDPALDVGHWILHQNLHPNVA